MHGSTFGGGPLACAVAVAVIDTMEKDGLLAHATEVGDYFQGQLRELAKRHEAIVDVRGKGLMVAAELDSAELAKLTVAEMLKRHILINCTSDTVLRFLPPYILKREHVDAAIAALDEIFTQHAGAHRGKYPQEDTNMVSKDQPLERGAEAVPVQKDRTYWRQRHGWPAKICVPLQIYRAAKCGPSSSWGAR